MPLPDTQDPKGPPLEEQVEDFSEDLERLKVSYEQYFMGLERLPPDKDRKMVEALMRQLLVTQTKNTGTRFKIHNLKARLVTYQTLWDRSLKQIEDGTFRRDRFRVKLYERNLKEREEREGKSEPAKDAPAAKRAPESAGAAAAKRNPQIEALMAQYVAAKRKCNERTEGLTYEAFSKTLTSQTSSLKQRYQCKSVRFKVVIEDGKTKLKATPT